MRQRLTLTTSTSPYSAPRHAIYFLEFDRPARVVRDVACPGGRYYHPPEHVYAEVITVGDEEIADVLDYHYGPGGWAHLTNVATSIDPPDEAEGAEGEPPSW